MMINKKQTWSDNPFDQWTEEELLCMKNQGICYGKGGGGSPPPAPAVQTQVQQSEFPSELKPFISDIFGKAQAIQEQREEEGFQAFEGPLQAQFDPAQIKAFERIEQIPGATQPLFDEATTLAREATRSPTDPQEVASFMNPFLRNVTDIQKREAERVADVEEQNLAAQAAQAGAFGGSRAAILEAERQRNLAQQLDDIEARGLAASYQDAQQRLANQRAREAAGATQLASLGSAIPAQQLKELGALSGVGAARQTQAQRGIDLARQEFEAEEAFPLRTLQEFSSILRGFPIEPTRTTTREQFSAAQPLSTQLLGVGTQALGALGAAGIKPFGQAGGMVREMPVKAQSGGALSSLMQKTEDLDTSPVIGMKRGGSFIEQILTGGLLATDKAVDTFKKLPKPMMKMLGGAALPQLLGNLGSRAEAPPPTIPQEELDKQIDAALRQRAAQGQQMASKGAGPAQVGAQIGQVRQPFKGGGGLRQMVQLPSNRVRFGKTAYQDVTEEQEKGFFARFFDPSRTYATSKTPRLPHGLQNQELNIGLPRNNPIGGVFTNIKGEDQVFDKDKLISAAPAALADDGDGGVAAEVEALSSSLGEAPRAPKTPAKVDDPAPAPDKKKEGTKLYRSPEEAAYASLIDSDAGQKAAERYFKGENLALANISEALKAYKGFKDTEMAQRRAINEAKIKEAATKRAARTAALKDADLLADIATKRDAPAIDRLKAATQGLKAVQDTLTALGESGKRAYQMKPDSPLGQQYAKALQQRETFLRIAQQYTAESPQSQFVGGLAAGQVPLGLNPALQQSIAGLLKKATS